MSSRKPKLLPPFVQAEGSSAEPLLSQHPSGLASEQGPAQEDTACSSGQSPQAIPVSHNINDKEATSLVQGKRSVANGGQDYPCFSLPDKGSCANPVQVSSFRLSSSALDASTSKYFGAVLVPGFRGCLAHPYLPDSHKFDCTAASAQILTL